jgi:hypothetical protein
VVDDRPRLQLMRTMILVAAARRHACERIRRRLQVGCVASIGLVAAIAAISLLQGLNAGVMAPPTQRGLAIIGLLASISLLVLLRCKSDEHAMVAAQDLDICVEGIDSLVGDLVRTHMADADRIHDVRRRYVECLRRCRASHTHDDYMAARVVLGHAARPEWPARLRYVADVYMREISVAALPLLFFAAL